jgi:hypothetical protein
LRAITTATGLPWHGKDLTQEEGLKRTPPKLPNGFLSPFRFSVFKVCPLFHFLFSLFHVYFSFPSNRDTKTIKNDLQLEENNRHEPFLIETILQGRLQARFAGFTAH